MTHLNDRNEAGGRASHKRKRPVRKYDPYQDCPTNLLFEPLFSVGKGARKVSAAKILLMRQYKDACEGKASGMRAMIRLIKENQKVRNRLQKERMEYAPVRFTLGYSTAVDPSNADAALLILGGATIDRKRLEYWARVNMPPPRWPLLLEPDAIVAARSRPDAPTLSRRQDDAVKSWTRSEDDPPVSEAELKGRPLYDPSILPRDPKSTRFVPGQSGNPKGRPPREKLELPFDDFLNEVIQVPVEREIWEMTRLGALFFHMMKRALERDTRIEQTLFDLVVEEQARRFTPTPEPIKETYI